MYVNGKNECFPNLFYLFAQCFSIPKNQMLLKLQFK